MTSLRTKRNSKVPNRFSSDNSQIETCNANGETIIDYNDNSTSTTHNLVPINRTIKLKPAIREPLKVKLPKLKRPNSQSVQKHDDEIRRNTAEIKIHKIKLPSLSARKKDKSDGGSNKSDSNIKQHIAATIKQSSSSAKNSNELPTSSLLINHNQQQNLIAGPKSAKKPSTPQVQATPSSKSATSLLLKTTDSHKSSNNAYNNKSSPLSSIKKPDISNLSSISVTNEDKSLMQNESFSSNDADCSDSAMKIVISSDKQQANSSESDIRCPCGVQDDLGVMIECENCSKWQHGHCTNVGKEEDAYDGYVCGFCIFPQGKARESLLQLTVGDKFESRFKILETLRKQQATNQSNDEHKHKTICYNEAEVSLLTIEELSQIMNELMRVLTSVKVKWRLMTSQAHEQELLLYRNPYWSDYSSENSEKSKSIYIMDTCRANLKMNLRNIIKKMEERCQLIDYSISYIQNKLDGGGDDSAKLKRLQESLDTIIHGVKEYKHKMKQFNHN